MQTLRGGSSSVFASHAPGAVINYISKTGKQAGGTVGLSTGVNYNEKRLDGEYGGKLASDLYYHVGGYYRYGESTRHYGSENALAGYQLKGNITKEFNDGKGFFRVYFKALDEHAPTTPQTFLFATKNGNTIGGFSKVPGYDGTRDSQYSIYNSTVTTVDPVTGAFKTTSLLDGITVNAKSLGFEFNNELPGGIVINDKFRKTAQSGAFQTQFWDVQTLGALLSGSGAASARYFNGPGAGSVVSNANLLVRDRAGLGLVSKGAAIDVQMGDMGNTVNDLSLSKSFKSDGMVLDLKAGLFHMVQNVKQVWSISEKVVEVGVNGRVLDLYNAAGTALTTGGLTGYNNQWGGCCARAVDTKFTTEAPYLGLNLAAGNFDIDAGVRRETFTSFGTYALPYQTSFDADRNGKIEGAEKNIYMANGPVGLTNYKINYTNRTLGVNYRVNNDLSVFARTSEGYRAIADRFLYNPPALLDQNTGQLGATGQQVAAAPVKQNELGTRIRGKANWGSYGASVTYFRSTVNEFDYDQTRQDNPALPNYAGPKLNILGYKADGFEVEGGFSMGIFSLNGNLTQAKSVKTADFVTSNIGKESGGVPRLRYNIIPRVTLGNFTVGGVIRGQGSVWADDGNTTKIDGHYVVNAFVNYDIGGGWIGTLNVNNVADKVFPTGGGGFVNGSASVFGAGPELGRTINAGVRYTF